MDFLQHTTVENAILNDGQKWLTQVEGWIKSLTKYTHDSQSLVLLATQLWTHIYKSPIWPQQKPAAAIWSVSVIHIPMFGIDVIWLSIWSHCYAFRNAGHKHWGKGEGEGVGDEMTIGKPTWANHIILHSGAYQFTPQNCMLTVGNKLLFARTAHRMQSLE